MAHRNYTGNIYNDYLGRLADRIPKSVLGAIAFSYAFSGGVTFPEEITASPEVRYGGHDNG